MWLSGNKSDLVTMRIWVQSLALLSGLRIWHCCELWCRLPTLLGSGVAVAVVQAGSYSSDWTPSLGTSICLGEAALEKAERPKKKKKKKVTLGSYHINHPAHPSINKYSLSIPWSVLAEW